MEESPTVSEEASSPQSCSTSNADDSLYVPASENEEEVTQPSSPAEETVTSKMAGLNIDQGMCESV